MSWGGRIPIGYNLTAYCGSPPDPVSLWARWNLDPILIAFLLTVAAAYFLLSRRLSTQGRSPPGWRRACFYTGWALASLAVVCPLCPLSVSLFSARIAQHMWLTTVCAPLVAVGLPVRVSGPSAFHRPVLASLAFAGALWIWHAPGPYLATFQSDTVYWLMHATLFGSALWLWRSLLVDTRTTLALTLAASMITTVQMGLLGAVITFAGHPIYTPHFLTTAAWGLTPLQDQQLGGVVMWVPAGAVLVAALIGGLALAMREADGAPVAATVT